MKTYQDLINMLEEQKMLPKDPNKWLPYAAAGGVAALTGATLTGMANRGKKKGRLRQLGEMLGNAALLGGGTAGTMYMLNRAGKETMNALPVADKSPESEFINGLGLRTGAVGTAGLVSGILGNRKDTKGLRDVMTRATGAETPVNNPKELFKATTDRLRKENPAADSVVDSSGNPATKSLPRVKGRAFLMAQDAGRRRALAAIAADSGMSTEIQKQILKGGIDDGLKDSLKEEITRRKGLYRNTYLGERNQVLDSLGSQGHDTRRVYRPGARGAHQRFKAGAGQVAGRVVGHKGGRIGKALAITASGMLPELSNWTMAGAKGIRNAWNDDSDELYQ